MRAFTFVLVERRPRASTRLFAALRDKGLVGFVGSVCALISLHLHQREGEVAAAATLHRLR